MGAILRDECIENLIYAQESMNEWIPMTEYEVIFEASEKSDIADKVAQNEETANKSVGFVRKAINAVIALIKKLYEAIKDFIFRCTMNGEERKAFNDFKEAMSLDPSLKNKKVTVQDFRKINAEYDNLINEIDKAIRDVKSNEEHPVDHLVKKVTDFTKRTATGVSAIVAAETAVRMAESNVETAKLLRKALKDDEGIMRSLSNSLGEKDALKVKRKIDEASKRTLLYRLKAKVIGHKYESLGECIKSVISTLTHEGYRDLSKIKDAKKSLKDDKKDGRITKEEYKKQMADLKNEEKEVKKEKLTTQDKRDMKNIQGQLLRNPNTSDTAKAIRDGIIKAKLDTVKDKTTSRVGRWFEDHVTDRDHKKRDKKGEYKSPIKFITGKD